MIEVAEAVSRIVAAFAPLSSEVVLLGDADGRVLASDVRAGADQPPEPVSSMDGYAVRSADVAEPGVRLAVIGSAPAGHPFQGTVGRDQAVRIFTGGVVPVGADAIVIQEDAVLEGAGVRLNVAAMSGRHIRAAGLDFRADSIVVPRGRRLGPRDLALLAAADVPTVKAVRKPRILMVATGDELSRPGETRKPGGIVASSGYALSALIARWGGSAIDMGILPDTIDSVAGIADRASEADLVVTLGGASVGDHDLVQRALGPRGFALDFWKIAMRPGKPLIFGKLGDVPLLGLPGNPVSTLVCAILFLEPSIAAMLGAASVTHTVRARAQTPLGANDTRQDYVRARLEWRDGEYWAEPFPVQDSSMMSTLAAAGGLIVRRPDAPAVEQGTLLDVLEMN
jgi:molybdopterin molybdotransferase